MDPLVGRAARSRLWVAPLVIGVLALAVRMALILRTPGGPTGLLSYDPGVYYAAGDALVHGRLPYRDFLFLHPPAVMLATAPFAEFGAWTHDELGFVAANFVFECMGALNAALVVVAGRRLGLPDRAARVAGIGYAVWIGAAGAEATIRLEPLGTLMFLVCLIWSAPVVRARGAGSPFLGGLFAGLACTVKIWWCVPALVVLAWLGVRVRRRTVILRFALGTASGIAAIAGPFFVLAPTTMWRMVVLDQLSRGPGPTLLARAYGITGVGMVFGTHSRQAHFALLVVALACLGVGVAAWRSGVRLPLVLLCVQVVVLAAGPSFFGFYENYAAASAALVLGSATTLGVGAWLTRIVLVCATATGTSYVLVTGRYLPTSQRFPAAELASGVADARCVMSDAPSALIELNALSRGLAAGCANWVDVTGRTYDVDRADASRPDNARWQASVLHYLHSGDAVILVRAGTGLSRATRNALHDDCVLAGAGSYAAYRTSARRQPELSRAACEASLDARRHPPIS